jgi:hypothetical protein
VSPFLSPGTSNDGAASGRTHPNPSYSSLVFLSTLVNNHKLQILLDTGSTNTFINKQIITRYSSDFIYLNTLPHSFLLADGIVPFLVHGTVKLHIQFATQTTTIDAFVADNLCADLILGMDYMVRYNLQLDIHNQTVSIQHNHQLYTLNFVHNIQSQFIPVILSHPTRISSQSSRSVSVSTPVASICSPFVPHSSFSLLTSVTVPQKFLEFRDHCSHMTLSNLSFRKRYIARGTCLGYLCQFSTVPESADLSHQLNTPCGAIHFNGKRPVSLGLSIDKDHLCVTSTVSESADLSPQLNTPCGAIHFNGKRPVSLGLSIDKDHLCVPSTVSKSADLSPQLNTPCGAIHFNGKRPVSLGLSIDKDHLCVPSTVSKSADLSHQLNTPCGAIHFNGKGPVSLGVSIDKDPSCVVSTVPNFETLLDTNLPPSIAQDFHELTKHVDAHHQRVELLALLSSFQSVFDTRKHNIAQTLIHHVINTTPHSPPASRPYLQPDTEEYLFHIIQEFLNAGLISESHSPYAAPAFLVKKKDGSSRLVVDYKKLNAITIKNCSPLPNMEDTLRKLGPGYQYFSKLDLKSGFYQIPIKEEDKEKTAFITSFGLFQFNVLPMGLKNSPPTFQKVMSNTLRLCRSFSLVYLDDIIVFSKSYDEHLDHLKQVFTALSDRHFVLNPPKCEILVQQIDYLGHTLNKDTIKPMTQQIDVILNMKDPRTLSAANKFIGALSWYRKFIPGFASVAAPIHAVTNLTKSNRRKFHWNFAQSQAFLKLKEMLTTEPLFLHFPVDDAPVILTTDASGIGIGGVLQQEVNGEMRNLYYHSQSLTSCERKYSTIEKEALAIYKCITRMRSFLLGRDIIIMTDHCPLCHIMTKTINNARVERIAHLIQGYNIIKVVHISGKQNCLPDYLSRFPRGPEGDLFDIDYGLLSKDTSESVTTLAPAPLVTMILRPRNKKSLSTPDEKHFHDIASNDDPSSLSKSSHPNSSHLHQEPLSHTFSTNRFDIDRLKDEQRNDPAIQQIVNQLRLSSHPLSFVLHDDVLYKLIYTSPSSRTKFKVPYVPSSMVNDLLQAVHNDPMSGGHFSFARTYDKLRNHYWWPGMRNSIRHHIKSCKECLSFNISRQKKVGKLHSVPPPDGPFQIIGMDFCGPLKTTPRGNKYVLVVTDYFTRYVTAIPLPSCTAEKTAETLYNDLFCKFGVPETIVSDQGTHFHNQLMTHMQHLLGYNHIYSTPYHPQSNGIVERFNSTFLSQLSKLQDNEHNNWDEYLQPVVFSYNSGTHKTTRYSPYQLVFGRSPRLVIHAKPSSFSFSRPNSYFNQLRKSLKYLHHSARNNIIRQQEMNKQHYDRNRLDPHYTVGDTVLTKLHGMKGKLDPLFAINPKIIISVQHPTYIVRDPITNIESRVHVGDIRPLLVD